MIAGAIHNDDPDAKPMWMPPGSFWTQPAGEVHITASRGTSVALVEISSGPYLVLTKDKANDSGERPVNVVPSNLVWLDSSNTSWVASPATKTRDVAQVSFLWGAHKERQLNGTFVKLPAGFRGKIRSLGESFKAVVIEGSVDFQLTKEAKAKSLTPGSCIVSHGSVDHYLSCNAQNECLIYVRSQGKFLVVPE